MNDYELLGIKNNDTEEEISIAYKRKAKEWHPDLNHAPNATDMFKQITAAYERVLKISKEIKNTYNSNPTDAYGYTTPPFTTNNESYKSPFEDVFAKTWSKENFESIWNDAHRDKGQGWTPPPHFNNQPPIPKMVTGTITIEMGTMDLKMASEIIKILKEKKYNIKGYSIGKQEYFQYGC